MRSASRSSPTHRYLEAQSYGVAEAGTRQATVASVRSIQSHGLGSMSATLDSQSTEYEGGCLQIQNDPSSNAGGESNAYYS